MNFNDPHPVLIAPRPVRLNQPSHAVIARTAHPLDRVKFSESPSIADFKHTILSEPPPEPDQLSPRASPRSGLPSEALEEFLSILRPTCFPPTSPLRRSRRQGAASLPVYAHDRSLSCHGRGLLEMSPPKDDGADSEQDVAYSRQASRNTMHSCTPEPFSELDTAKGADVDFPPFRWFKANILSSPISRNHTRNPFSRQVATASPSPHPHLSPAEVPLPLPTPDEMREIL